MQLLLFYFVISASEWRAVGFLAIRWERKKKKEANWRRYFGLWKKVRCASSTIFWQCGEMNHVLRWGSTCFGAARTLHSGTPSFRVHSLCVLCRDTQSAHTGSSSFSQYRASGIPCRVQVSSPAALWPDPQLEYLLKVSQTSRSERLEVSPPSSNGFLHKGHILTGRKLCFRHSRQKLWEQGSTTGSSKILRHTGQVRPSLRGEASPDVSSSICSAIGPLHFTFAIDKTTKWRTGTAKRRSPWPRVTSKLHHVTEQKKR